MFLFSGFLFEEDGDEEECDGENEKLGSLLGDGGLLHAMPCCFSDDQ